MSDTKSDRKQSGAVGYFIRPSDKRQIWIYPRRGEATEIAIQRVTSRHGVKQEEVVKL